MTTTTDTTIIAHPVDKYRAETYGIIAESGNYRMTGPGLHNRHHPHVVQVWSNVNRPNPTGETKYLDPSNRPTDNTDTVVMSAQAIMIDGRTRLTYEQDAPLAIGDTVHVLRPDLTTTAHVITRRYLADPELVTL